MAARYCEVALPVPLRSTFTYAVPAGLNGEDLVGRRLVVPFRNRAMVGVGIAVSDRAPEVARVKEIAELMDTLPAFPPKLIELGHWISRYYLAPVGETFRAMLPPEIELRQDREYRLTAAGRAHLQELAPGAESTRRSTGLAILRRFDFQDGSLLFLTLAPRARRRGASGKARSPRTLNRPKRGASPQHAHAKNRRVED